MPETSFLSVKWLRGDGRAVSLLLCRPCHSRTGREVAQEANLVSASVATSGVVQRVIIRTGSGSTESTGIHLWVGGVERLGRDPVATAPGSALTSALGSHGILASRLR